MVSIERCLACDGRTGAFLVVLMVYGRGHQWVQVWILDTHDQRASAGSH